MKRYVPDLKYIGSGDYIPHLREEQPGDDDDFDTVVLYSEAQAKIEALESELRNIAYAKRSNFTDCYEFMLWAQSRARHTLESTEVKP